MNGTAKKAETLIEPSLKKSELRYSLFETAQDGILILDAQTGAITDVNPFLIKSWDIRALSSWKRSFGKWVHSRMLKPARKPSKLCRRMNIFATTTCRLEQKTADWWMWNSSA